MILFLLTTLLLSEDDCLRAKIEGLGAGIYPAVPDDGSNRL
jgi:hypothetical protein